MRSNHEEPEHVVVQSQSLERELPISNDGADSSATPRRVLKIATVSHTLDAEVAERLRHFAFRERISESAVIEFALREIFRGDDDADLGRRLRESGAALRRKSS